MNNLIAIVAVLSHLALGAYIFHAFLKYFVPEEYAPAKQPRRNERQPRRNERANTLA